MAEKKNTTQISENRQEIKELIRTGKAFTFIGNAITKAYKGDDGEYYVDAIASSDRIDLVGDTFTAKALGIMKDGFIGKTAFMNHRTNVPDDVFGSIVETDRTKQGNKELFLLKFIVEQENEPAMKTWRMLSAGRVQLGTSVTVLVKSAKPNSKTGGIIIDDIDPIEVSIVGVPCNPDAVTMTATASKALEVAGKSYSEAKEDMKVEKSETATTEVAPPSATEETAADAAADAPAAVSPDPAASENTTSKLFPKAIAAANRLSLMISEVTGSQTAKSGDDLPKISAKALFADMVDHPPFWDLLDTLADCYYQLVYQIYNLEYAGETDFSEIQAEWSACLQEFATRCEDSFSFWKVPLAEGDETVVSASLEEAQSLHKMAETIGELISASAHEKAHELIAIGKSLLEIAEKAGIPFTPAESSEETSTDVTVEIDVTKTKEFQDMVTRAEQAETKSAQLEQELATANKDLSEAKDDLEVTKAGLAAAVEATNAALRQPLQVGSPS